MANTTKQYFSERQGRGPKAEPLPFSEFRELVISVFDHFREQGYMTRGDESISSWRRRS